jgi:hypothetical protein
MPSDHQAWVRPVSSRCLAGSGKKIWQETAKTSGSVKPSRSGWRKSGSDAHVAVEQDDDVVFRGLEAGIRAAAEAQVFRQGDAGGLRGSAARTNSALPSVEPLSTTMISLPGWPAHGLDERREVLLEQVAAIPVGDDDRGGNPGAEPSRRGGGGRAISKMVGHAIKEERASPISKITAGESRASGNWRRMRSRGPSSYWLRSGPRPMRRPRRIQREAWTAASRASSCVTCS